jgi:enamine deaminase RidA (YjgF/YER057c/UK114 family)
MRASVVLLAAVLMLSVAAWAQPQPKPIRRPPNNQLALEGPDAPPTRIEAPQAVSGNARHLVFHVSPLSSKGLLSQQVEDALKALDKANGAATFLKLRAFVSGGDLRRVQTVVSDFFTARKWPVPALTTIQVGALLQEGAQVVIESISEEKRPVVEAGIRFFPALPAASGAEAVGALHAAMGPSAAAALRVTCFADSLAEAAAARAAAAQRFPKAAGVFVQATRFTLGARAQCEGVAHGPDHTGKLAFTAAQLTFGEEPADLKLALDRTGRALASVSAPLSSAVFFNVYGVTRELAARAAALAPEAPQTVVFIEGLPALDATVAIEAVAAAP